MAIKIEVLSENRNSTRVAYYFRIDPADMLLGAEDQTRVPAGNQIVGQELLDLKIGSIMEIVQNYNAGEVDNMDVDQKQAFFVTEWDRLEQKKLVRYNKRFQLIGDYYDGVTWRDA